jgi:hypothetical protein
MISWSTIGIGAALSALAAGLLVALVARGHRFSAGLCAAAGAGGGSLAWNAILHVTQANAAFSRLLVSALPVGWQDICAGVFALAATAIVLGLGPLTLQPAQRTLTLSLLAGLAAFLVNVFWY